MSALDNEIQARQSIENIATRAAEAAAQKTMTSMLQLFGIDTTDPIKSQEEFAALRSLARLSRSDKFKDDLEFLARLHAASDGIKDVSIKTIAKVLVTTALAIFALGTKDWWLNHFLK